MIKDKTTWIRRLQVAALLLGVLIIVQWLFGFRLSPAPAQAQAEHPPAPLSNDLPVSEQVEMRTSRQPSPASYLAQTPATPPGLHIVQPGETVQSIAYQHNLRPETVLWSNPDLLGDDPGRLAPGMTLVILPVDGLRHQWEPGDRISRLAWLYGVPAEAIVSWNGLTPSANGDVSMPVGDWLVIPGGQKPFQSRFDATPADPDGWCQGFNDGLVGTGRYVWPTLAHYLSGYNFAGEHLGIDLAGRLGDPVMAVDDGVVIAAGMSQIGYGRTVVLDHGNGWYSLYAHLDTIQVSCGQGVYQGELLGRMGSTGNSSGPHLHLEIYDQNRRRVDPLSLLPTP